mmetsp:Transcript_10543/g.30015  ORF Transcript_10543/g.30015 Transcript_10543/m.30015 type:complete len:207 (+) Transcript_10543:667-1287(+)
MKGSSAPRGLLGHLVAALMNSIMPEMAVLNLISSVSAVMRFTIAAVTFICSVVASTSSTPSDRRRQARARKRWTPSTPLVFQTFVSRRGPMNISYNRRESAPYLSTTSSGLMTLPRLLLILWALADTLTSGLAFSTGPLGVASQSASSSFTGWASGLLSSTNSPAEFLYAVYSTSPRIIPWLTSFWKGSLVLTTPMSYNTLCQKRA